MGTRRKYDWSDKNIKRIVRMVKLGMALEDISKKVDIPQSSISVRLSYLGYSYTMMHEEWEVKKVERKEKRNVQTI